MGLKHARLLLGFAGAFLFLSGCSDHESLKENTIKTAELSQRESGVIGQASDFYFLYDFSAGEAFNSVSVWAESYEKGKKSEVVLGPLSTDLQEKEGYLFFSKNRAPENAEESLFNLGIGEGDSVSSGNYTAYFTSEAEKAHVAQIKTDFAEEGITIKGKHILGAYTSSDENSLSSISLDPERDVEEQLEELEGYKSVYVFMAEFKK